MKYITLFVGLMLLASGIWYVVMHQTDLTSDQNVTSATSFTECVEQGNPVMESYPRQCRDAAGNHFVEDITVDWEASYTNASPDLIVVNNLEAGDTITSPLTITGLARGYWFFEASFPVVLTDWDGRIIVEHYATAEGDWMTEEFVPFTLTLEFDTPEAGGLLNRGTIILQRDNPSDLPENDGALEIPILFN